MYNDPVNDSLNKSRENLERVSNSMRDSVGRTAQDIRDTWGDRAPAPRQTVEPRREPPIVDPKPTTPNPAHTEVRSDYDYESPYGRYDENNYHAVCIDVNDKIYFLGGENKKELENKVNNDNNIKDVLAVYGGNLIYYHERRYLFLD